MILAAPAFAKPVVFKFSHVVAENTPNGQMSNTFKELVDQPLPARESEREGPVVPDRQRRLPFRN